MIKAGFWIAISLFFKATLMVAVPDTLFLVPNDTSYILSGPYFTELEDTTGKLSFSEILGHSSEFKTASSNYFSNAHIPSAYWFKLRFANRSMAESYYLVSHNYGLSEIDVYWLDSRNRVCQAHYDRKVSVYDRNIIHRQPVFNISIPEGEALDVYIRLKNSYSFAYTFELYSLNRFLSYYTIEYLLFGIFYGMLLFVVLYNFTLYVSLRQGYLVALVVFTIIQIITMSFRDGTAIFLFLQFSTFTQFLDNFSLALFFILITVYCILYLNLHRDRLVFYYMCTLCTIRLFSSISDFDYKDFYAYHLNLLILGSCLVFSLYKWLKKEPLAKYIFWGVFSLFVTYFIYYLSLFKVIPVNNFSFFSLYFGVVGESIFFTLASSEKIKLIKLQHMQMEQTNKDLELMVDERTKIIQHQNEMLELKADELNQFLYKSSHDLKGPIKSIEGLCIVAKLEKPEKHTEYLEKIHERTIVLGNVISDLNQVMIANNAPMVPDSIDFEILHHEICRLFEVFPGYSETEISFQWLHRHPFFADKKLVSSIYQNLLENAIKYRDRTKKSMLWIEIDSTGQQCTLIFKDNGIGIPKELQEKVFEMFFRANDTFQDSNGLGLYLVKVSVDKLNGKIWIDSEVGVGTTMKIVFNT